MYNFHKSKTVKSLIFRIYSSQKVNSTHRGHVAPCYTRDEFFYWATDQEIFFNLYDEWVKSGYKKDLVPSCDRLNDYLPYTFDNIRLTTWGENNRRAHFDRKNGLNNKNSNAVIQESVEGVFVNKYYSHNEASRQTGVSQSHISKCCSGKRKTAGGFKWRCVEK